MKKNICLLICIIITFTLSGCSLTNSKVKTVPKEKESDVCLDIVTTNKLLYFMVKDIVGDKHIVDYILKDFNDYEEFFYSQDTLSNMEKQNLFFYTGSMMEPWIDEFVDKIDKSNVGIINVSRGVKTIEYSEKIPYKNTYLTDNPYYWMDLDNYKVMLSNIKNAVEEKDPKSRSVYEKNFSNSLKSVDELKKEMDTFKDNLKDYTFFVSNEKLSYFIKFFGLTSVKLNSDTNSDDAKIEKEKNEGKKLIFIYEDEESLKDYKVIIQKYNISTVNIITYTDKLNYIDTLKYDIESLKALFK